MSSISAGTTSTTTLVHSGDTTGSLVFKTNDTGSGGTTAVTIDTSQNVGIGGAVTNEGGYGKVLQITGSTDCVLELKAGSSYSYLAQNGTNLQIRNNDASGAMTFSTNATERMRIDSSGNLLVGQTTTVLTGTIQFTYDGSSRQGMCIKNSANSQNGAAIRFIDYTNAYTGGGIYYTSSNSISYATSSDYRLKENIAPMTGALAKVEQLKPVIFNWKQDNSASQGFIAHELQDIIPEAVIGTKDSVDADGKPMYQGVDTSYIVATLTAALQETKALLDTQAETINALTARIVALEGQ